MDLVEAAVRSVGNPNVTYIGSFDLSEHPVSIIEEVRRACEMNYCGHYGRSWSCPPHVPPCPTCESILSRYDRVILIRTTHPRDGPFDLKGMGESMAAHARYTFEVRDRLRGMAGLGFKMLGAGACSLCRSCPCPEGRCIHPQDRMFSIESYGIDLTAFLLSNGIDRRGGNTEQSYFSMVFYSQPPDGSRPLQPL